MREAQRKELAGDYKLLAPNADYLPDRRLFDVACDFIIPEVNQPWGRWAK
jgi:hypothetical protein